MAYQIVIILNQMLVQPVNVSCFSRNDNTRLSIQTFYIQIPPTCITFIKIVPISIAENVSCVLSKYMFVSSKHTAYNNLMSYDTVKHNNNVHKFEVQCLLYY